MEIAVYELMPCDTAEGPPRRTSSAMAHTVPAYHLRIVLDTAVEKGASAKELCEAIGVELDVLDDLEARVPLEAATGLYNESARRTGDAALGLHVAERSDFFAFDALGFAISTKNNFREVFEHLAAAIMALQGVRMELDVVEDAACLSFEMPEEQTGPCRHRTEAYMARIIRMMELATGARPRPRRVAFRHPKPSDVSEHQRIFAAPLSFGAPRNEVVFDRSVLEIPFVRADLRLSQVLDQHISDLVKRMPAQQTLTDQVRRYVRDAFPRGDVGIESIGRRMGVGVRTLQRQLSAEGTSYRQIVEQARQELALRYLAETQTPIKEVAVLLAYSELQAFYRAFERWTGLPPAAYRRRSS